MFSTTSARGDRVAEPGPIADVVDGRVILRSGAQTVDLHPLWLRERSTDAVDADPINGQRLFEPTDVGTDVRVVAAAVCDDGRLEVSFDDGHQMAVPLASLVSNLPGAPPRPVAWRAADLDVPVYDYAPLVSDNNSIAAATKHAILKSFFERGVFVLRGTPARPDALHEITSHFGRISSTNFGVLFNVRTEPVPVDLAYTPVALSAHTDQPYRAPTPGLQFLHTIVNDAPGGASTMVDGLAAVQDLAAADPEAYEVLSTLEVEFRYDIGTDVKVGRAPLIDRHPDGSLRQIRFSPRLDFAPAADHDLLDVYYRGRRWLSEALNDPRRQVEYRMNAGDTLVVDNHRVLHGRTSFDPTYGHRHLQGCYIDHDGPVTEWILAARAQQTV